MARLLVVDDEQDLCEILQYRLTKEGYEVDTANSAEEALQLPLAQYDLILLDVMMGEMSGFEFARMLKDKPETARIPIIFTTALDGEDNMIHGLDIGADDYISKPLSMKEVRARVAAVLRRSQKQTSAEEQTKQVLTYQTLALNMDSKILTMDGVVVPLTKIEFRLLSLFLENADKVLSREDLINRCWPVDTLVFDRTVDVNITRLRKKIGEYGKQIKSRFGYGYIFEK